MSCGARDEPAFEAPWQAQAFALTVMLVERGAFTWGEWTERFAALRAPDTANAYYEDWLVNLESLVVEKGLGTVHDLTGLAAAWDRAARATPHGQPIELGADERG